MIRRNTMIIVVIFVILLAATLFWQRTKSREDSLAGDATPMAVEPSLVDVGDASVIGITLQDANRNTVKVALDQDGEWQLLIPEAPADSSVVGATIDSLLSATAMTTLSSSMSLTELGLSPAAYTVVLELDNGGQILMNIGNETPTGSGYYVLTSAQDRKLYIVRIASLTNFLTWLEQPPVLPPTPTPTVEIPVVEETPGGMETPVVTAEP